MLLGGSLGITWYGSSGVGLLVFKSRESPGSQGTFGISVVDLTWVLCSMHCYAGMSAMLDHMPDCRVCQWRTRELLNKKILAHLGAVYSKFYTLFWPKTLYLHCILQGFYHFSFFVWLFKRTYKYFCAPAPQCFAFVHPRSRRKVPYSAVWITWKSSRCQNCKIKYK